MNSDRPARRQVSQPVSTVVSRQQGDVGYTNIWEGRTYRSDYSRGRGTIVKSDYKCHSKIDSGWTRGEKAGTRFVCVYFARGVCHYGSDCNYSHRVPDADFELYHRTQPQYDIFGRDRSLDVDGNMKGVGSMNRDCTTLYLYLGALASVPAEKVEEMVREDFQEWGEIEEVNIVSRKAVGFVRYIFRSSAEFAKAAMHQQQLTGDDTTGTVLDVRWAYDDPNPKAVERVRLKREKMLADAYMAAIDRLPEEERVVRLNEIALAQGYREGAVTSAYVFNTNMNDNNDGDRPHPDSAADNTEEEEEEEEEDDVRRYLTPEEIEELGLASAATDAHAQIKRKNANREGADDITKRAKLDTLKGQHNETQNPSVLGSLVNYSDSD